MTAAEVQVMQQNIDANTAGTSEASGSTTTINRGTSRRLMSEFKSINDTPVEGVSCFLTDLQFWKV